MLTPLPRVFLRKRVHKVMKTKGRHCKKVQRVRIMLRTLQIARIADAKRFWDHGYTPTPLFRVENKGLGPTNTEKRGCMWLKTLRSFLQESAEITVGGGQVTLDPGRCRMVFDRGCRRGKTWDERNSGRNVWLRRPWRILLVR
jgi:hypothetical protein